MPMEAAQTLWERSVCTSPPEPTLAKASCALKPCSFWAAAVQRASRTAGTCGPGLATAQSVLALSCAPKPGGFRAAAVRRASKTEARGLGAKRGSRVPRQHRYLGDATAER